MALRKSTSNKCPVCLTRKRAAVNIINKALKGMLEDVKQHGEVPHKKDPRYLLIGQEFSIAPNSLRYHLKECLVDQEIQDQRLIELKGLTEALGTAKAFYGENPSVDRATSYTSLVTSWRQLAKDVEGQVDPEVTVEFMVENVVAAITRGVLSSVAEGLKELRGSLYEGLPAGQRTFIKSQMDMMMSQVAQDLKGSTEDAMQSLCEYYRVDMETKQKKRAIESAVPSDIPTEHEVN